MVSACLADKLIGWKRYLLRGGPFLKRRFRVFCQNIGYLFIHLPMGFDKAYSGFQAAIQIKGGNNRLYDICLYRWSFSQFSAAFFV